MAYRDFTFEDLESKFGIKQTTKQLFTQKIVAVEPSAWLLESLKRASNSSLTTEKAISEAIVYPVLQEIKFNNSDTISLFSGENLNADKKNGLNGKCDFILTQVPQSIELRTPIFNVTEAKQGIADHPRSLAQTAAQMLGARTFSANHHKPLDTIYGVCTSGLVWIFLLLEGNTLFIDTDRYTTTNIPQLLGTIQKVVDFYE